MHYRICTRNRNTGGLLVSFYNQKALFPLVENENDPLNNGAFFRLLFCESYVKFDFRMWKLVRIHGMLLHYSFD